MNFKKLVIAIIVVTLLGIASCEVLCKLGVKCKNCEQVSLSKKESIKDNFFVGAWAPTKRDCFLKYHDASIRLDTAWGEQAWVFDSKICLLTKKKKVDDFHLILPFKKSDSLTFLFTLEHFEKGKVDKSIGGIEEGRKVLSLPKLVDTIDYLLVEIDSNASIGWTKGGIVIDTIHLIRVRRQ